MNTIDSIPATKTLVDESQAKQIRQAVRSVDTMPSSTGVSRLARSADAGALLEFLNDPKVYAPIYTLPRPLTLESVQDFIEQHESELEEGVGLLFLSMDEAGRVAGYSDVQVWPQWACGELGGALHPDRQSQGLGAQGAFESFKWMFETLKLERICETASLENIRTAKMLDGIGFKRMGEVTSRRPDGSTRQSLVWELTKQEWEDLHG